MKKLFSAALLSGLLAVAACSTPATSLPPVVGKTATTVTTDVSTVLAIANAAIVAYSVSPKADPKVVVTLQADYAKAVAANAAGDASLSLAINTLNSYLAAQAVITVAATK